MKARFIPVLFMAAMLCIAACSDGPVQEIDFRIAAEETAPAVVAPIRVGFGVRLSIAEGARQYSSLLQYLEKATGQSFDLKGYVTEVDLIQGAAAGELDLVIGGAGTLGPCLLKHEFDLLVLGRQTDGSSKYRGAIITLPESNIRTVKEIRRKRFAFGNPNSTQGHVIPRIMLRDAGILLSDLTLHEYCGSHTAVAEAVLGGVVDAGGVQDLLAERLEAEGRIRVVAWSDSYPSSGIAILKTINADIVKQLKTALLAFDNEDAKRCYLWNETEMAGGFASPEAGIYSGLIESMVEFGMVNKE